MPHRPPKKKKHKMKITPFPGAAQENPAISDLSSMVGTPENVMIQNPKLRRKLLANHATELVQQNTQLQDQILAMQLRIGGNNLVIQSIQHLAAEEGLDWSFNFAPPPQPEAAQGDTPDAPTDLPPVAPDANENTPAEANAEADGVPPTQ